MRDAVKKFKIPVYMYSYLTEVSPAVLRCFQLALTAQVLPSCTPLLQCLAPLRRPQRSEPRSRSHTGCRSPPEEHKNRSRSSRAAVWWRPQLASPTCLAREWAVKYAGPRTSLILCGQKYLKCLRQTSRKQRGTQRSRRGGCGPPNGNMAQSSQRWCNWCPWRRWHKASRGAAAAPSKMRHDAATKHMMACGWSSPGRQRESLGFTYS